MVMLSLTGSSVVPLRSKAVRSARTTRLRCDSSKVHHEMLVDQRPAALLVRRCAELAAAVALVATICSESPVIAAESVLQEPSAETSAELGDRPKMNCARPTLKSVQPEGSTADTRLGQASEAATHEMRIRAAMFDDAVTRTNNVKQRTQGFVKNMWQSLE